MRRRQDTDAARAQPRDMGWLGGHRKAREVTPPEPEGQAIGDMATGKVHTATAERDFGNMANPLANGARKSQKQAWPFTGAPAQVSSDPRGHSNSNGHTPAVAAPATPAAAGSGLGAGWNEQHSAQAADAYFGNYGVRMRAAGGTTSPSGYQYAGGPQSPSGYPYAGGPQLQSGYPSAGGPQSPSGYQAAPAAVPAPAPAGWNQAVAAPPQLHPQAAAPAPAQASSHGPALGAWAGVSHDQEDYYEDDYRIPKVLVLDRGGQFSSEVARATVDLDSAPEVFRLNRPTQVVEVALQEEPDVIVVAPAEVTEAGLKRLAQVHQEDPRIVIVLAENGKPLSASSVAACGAGDILPQHPTKAKMKARLVRALHTAQELHEEHHVVEERVVVREVQLAAPPAPPAAPPAPAPRPEVQDRVPYIPSEAPAVSTPRRAADSRSISLARVFTIASASGGCGKTFYSTNLAAYLAKATGGKVLLVDLDLQFGEVAISLHLRPKRTIAELVQEEDMALALPDYLVEHSAGFKVLCAPKDPITGDRVGPRETTAVLEAARQAFDYIVVDTPPSLNETCLAAFDQSQSLVIMATMDLPSLKNLRIFLETLKKLNLPADQVALVVNKAESGTGIDLKEIEPLYPQGFSAVLPYAKQVSWSINMGVPVLMADPNSDISRKLVAGAAKLVPPSARVQLPWSTSVTTVKRGWFSRLMKGNK